MDRRSFHQFVGGLVDQLSELSRQQLLHVAHAVGTKAQAGRACGRTFNCLTGTPLARLRLKDKWLGYCATPRCIKSPITPSMLARASMRAAPFMCRTSTPITAACAPGCTTFRGVATRYLDNYCGWRRAIDGSSSTNARINSPEEFLRAAVGVFRS